MFVGDSHTEAGYLTESDTFPQCVGRDLDVVVRNLGRINHCPSEELVILQEFLPAALSETEINQLVDEAIEKTGAASIKEMGKVMGMLKPQLQGRADMGQVSQLIKTRLSA